MLIWGGTGNTPNGDLGDGAAYNPAANTWRPLPAAGAPRPGSGQAAVWTGTEMLVWSGTPNKAVAYDPVTNGWRSLPTVGAPSPRGGASVVWTGTEMLVWGGGDASGYRNDGAAYNPTTDAWRPLPTDGAPSPRSGQTAVWTGTEMLIWGGVSCPDQHALGFCGDGAAYNPATNTWRPLANQNAPRPRDEHTAVWTGSQMLIWGASKASELGCAQ